MSIPYKKIKTLALHLGFDLCSFSPAVISQRDQAAYREWCAAGKAAEMKYMTREPDKRTNIQAVFPSTQTVLSLGVSYFQGPLPKQPGPGFGRVARYAWGLDYHTIIEERLRLLLNEMKNILGADLQATVAVDTKPILERALAQSAGLGFIGKNTVLISTKREGSFHKGSWIFLSEILLDLPCEDSSYSQEIVGCGGCTQCLTACPTNALDVPYQLDSRKCISYLTIENKGWIPQERRREIGHWIYGCDICQDACPFNARAKQTTWPEFQAEKGVGAWMDLKDILTMPSQEIFLKKWGHTPLVRAKRRGLVRNACVVAGNSGETGLIPFIRPLLQDSEPLVRGHAAWAWAQLEWNTKSKFQIESLWKNDPDPDVKKECENLLEAGPV